MEEIKDVWGFVERYYPNYSSCDEILMNNDLSKIVEEDENADESIQQKMHESNAYVFEKAIKGYLEEINNNQTPTK